MSVVNEWRVFFQHESCKCRCGLNESVCNSKQKWNHNESRWECKQLEDRSFCKDEYIWKPSTCDCECKKAYKIGEYLHI